ncbi:flagellar hook-length control protein FliK [Salinimonas sediminis]|uniref:Flagellar hook-length control protein FliK n=1 Tax=Salinimonas sediminis TaxID=2303538 RepID=A0A346NJN9_9ALTE|nr:flagellar hook-length control protein FliK [Salinimonas sediminis]AXR05746.1 flagellar hook-length control protein FliK [Salinimonas sediminis]
MMQQVAPKRQDVAALPIDIGGSPAQSSPSTADSAFSEAMQQANHGTPRNTSNAPAHKQINPDNQATNKARSEAASAASPAATEQASHSADNDAAVAAPASEDLPANPVAAQQQEDDAIDWLAYVDRIRGLKDDEAQANSTHVEAGEGKPVHNTDLVGLLSGELDRLNEQLLEEAATTPGAGDQQHITPIPVLVGTLSKEIVKQLSALAEEGSDDGDDSGPDIEALAAALLEGLAQQNNADGSETDSQHQSQDFMAELARLQQNNEATGNADAELLAALLKTEINALAQGNGAADNSGQAGAALTADSELLEQLAGLSQAGQQQLSQAISERVIDLLPSTTSEAQKGQIAESIAGGLQEMQDQLAQGHQPGFSIKDMISQAVSEAEVAITSVMQHSLDQQLSQLASVLTATQASTQAAAAQLTPTMAVTSADAMHIEQAQLRNETVVSTRQAETQEQAVNIAQPDGQKQLTEKVRWMVNSRNMMAEIRLDPPEMGSMQVRVNVQGDAASVSFVVQSAQTRDALNDAEPRLREMLAEQGIELGQSSVEQQAGNNAGEDNQEGSRSANGRGGNGATGTDDETQTIAEQPLTRRALGGIDDYA